jgi:hypothetical protein
MHLLRQIIRQSIQLFENTQLADKVYFNTGKLSPEAKEIILRITGGDAYTKIVSDIFYAQSVKTNKDVQAVSNLHLQLKSYNKNVFPIKGFNINGVKDTLDLINALKNRSLILDEINKLPSIAELKFLTRAPKICFLTFPSKVAA